MENTNNAVAGQTMWIELKLVVIPEDARYHAPEEVAAAAQSLKKNGLLQEIVVCPQGDGRYEVRAGVCRTLAAQSLNWEKIRCNIRPVVSDYEKRLITFEENDKRQDASPIYQAQLLEAMRKGKNLDQRELAEEVGKTEAWVSQYLSLLSFSPEVQKNLTAVKFSIKQLLELKKLPTDEAQLAAAKECEGMTNEGSKKVIHKHLAAHGNAPKTKKAKVPSADLAWKGEEIAINRHYKPTSESVADFVAWLSQTLPAFAEHNPAASETTHTPTPSTESQAIPAPTTEQQPVAAPDPISSGTGTATVETQSVAA